MKYREGSEIQRISMRIPTVIANHNKMVQVLSIVCQVNVIFHHQLQTQVTCYLYVYTDFTSPIARKSGGFEKKKKNREISKICVE